MDEYYKYVYNDRTAITSLIQQLNMLAAKVLELEKKLEAYEPRKN